MVAFKVEELGHEPRNVSPTRNWKRQGNGLFLPRTSRKECSLADTMILAH